MEYLSSVSVRFTALLMFCTVLFFMAGAVEYVENSGKHVKYLSISLVLAVIVCLMP